MEDEKDEKEKEALEELKKRMKGDMEKEMYEDDYLFYRFLRARDFKVDNAEAMLRQNLEWRKKNDVKNVLKWSLPEVMKKYFHLPIFGSDKDGCIVKYNHFGTTDFRGIFESITPEDWYKSLIFYFEEDILLLKKQTEKLGKNVDKIIYIENLEHFSLAKATDKKVISNMIVSINMYLNNYPETLKTIYAINAPVYFNIFFSVLKAFLPSTVLKKIKVYSDDSWKKDLLEEIDAEVIPAFLGGKRTDPDGNPLCLTLIPNSESVPKTCYMNKNKRSFPTITDAEKVTISRTSVHEILLEVTEPDSHLEWEFEIKSGDIKFGLFYQDREGRKFELAPPQKISSNERTESGLYKCEKSGSYIAVFDNSFSLVRSKEICYKISIKDPRELISS